MIGRNNTNIIYLMIKRNNTQICIYNIFLQIFHIKNRIIMLCLVQKILFFALSFQT